jgi:hypothetical protein
MHNQSWRYLLLFAYEWWSIQHNAHLANYLLGINENQTSIRKSHTNNTPFIATKTKSERKKKIKEKKNFTPKRKIRRTITLIEIKTKRSISLWWPSPGFLTQLVRREKECMGFKLHSTGKTQWKWWRRLQDPINKLFILQKGKMSRLKGKRNWLTRSLSRRDTEENPKKGSSGGFFGQKEADTLLPKERSIIVLCAKLWGRNGGLLTLGQGR